MAPRNAARCASRSRTRQRLEEILSVRPGAQGDRRSHRELGGKPLGRAAGRSLCGTSRSAGRNRTATRWLALAALSRPLLASEPLPERAAIGKSFRPTASRPCRSKPKTPNQDQNQIPSASQSPLAKALEADNSKWQKTGHFYFALTDDCPRSPCPGTRQRALAALAPGSRSSARVGFIAWQPANQADTAKNGRTAS